MANVDDRFKDKISQAIIQLSNAELHLLTLFERYKNSIVKREGVEVLEKAAEIHNKAMLDLNNLIK